MDDKSFWTRLKEAFNPPEAPDKPAPGGSRPNLWGLNGRQTQMQIRNLMQLKAFERKK